MKGICKHYGEEFDCCKLLSDFSNPMPDLRPCTKDEYECEYYKPHTNFDRITASVESLAKVMANSLDCTSCPCSNESCFGCDSCEEKIKEWLQKECEG